VPAGSGDIVPYINIKIPQVIAHYCVLNADIAWPFRFPVKDCTYILKCPA
jgi:hypothetical protein